MKIHTYACTKTIIPFTIYFLKYILYKVKCIHNSKTSDMFTFILSVFFNNSRISSYLWTVYKFVDCLEI